MYRIFLILFLLINFNVFAHQPKLINYSPSKDNPHEVIDPETVSEDSFYLTNIKTNAPTTSTTTSNLNMRVTNNNKPELITECETGFS